MCHETLLNWLQASTHMQNNFAAQSRLRRQWIFAQEEPDNCLHAFKHIDLERVISENPIRVVCCHDETLIFD